MLKFKKLFFLVCIGLFMSSGLQAQKVESVFDKYGENKAFRYVSISKGMVNLASLFGKEDAGNKEMLSRIDGMKVLTLKSKRKSKVSKAFFIDIEKTLNTESPFETLMEAREKGVYTKVLNRVNKKHKTDILIVSKSDSVQHFIWLTGNISIAELQNMIKK